MPGSSSVNSSPPEPRHRVALAHAGQEPLRDRAQQLVARGLAQRVVHLLEAVEVDEEERHAVAIAVRLGQSDLEPVLEQAPVGKPRERVVVRERAQPFAELARRRRRRRARQRAGPRRAAPCAARPARGRRRGAAAPPRRSRSRLPAPATAPRAPRARPPGRRAARPRSGPRARRASGERGAARRPRWRRPRARRARGWPGRGALPRAGAAPRPDEVRIRCPPWRSRSGEGTTAGLIGDGQRSRAGSGGS